MVNDEKKEELRNFRRVIADKVKNKKEEYGFIDKILEPTDIHQDLEALTALNDPALKKLEIPHNPME